MTRLILVSAFCVFDLPSQTLTITPPRALADQSVRITGTGLQPHEHVTVRAGLIDGDNQRWQSQAEFIADDQGNVDLSQQAPVQGAYKEVSAMGLIWAMMPGDRGVTAYHPPPNLAPQTVQFELVRDGKTVATAQLQQDAVGEGVKQIKVTGKLHGMLLVPAGTGPCPAVLVLGGSEGGVPRRRAAWLASHGYAAFALAYFRYEDLPARLEAIPLEYFGQALAWMMKRPEILSSEIAVMGTSRGGELALQLGSIYPQIKAIIAYVPANIRYRACCGENSVPYAWTWGGQPLAFARRDEHGPEALLAAIQVEKSKGPLLLIAGGQDHVWDSAGMVSAVVTRLKHEHFAYPVEKLTYPHAGHSAGRPEIVPEWHGQLRHPVSGRPIDPGGSPEGNAQSSLDATPKVLDFLRRSLPGSPPSQ